MEFIVPAAGVLAVLFAFWLAQDVFRRDTGTPEMQVVSNAIFEGAIAYLRRQYQTIGMLAVVTGIVIGALVGFLNPSIRGFDFGTTLAFFLGALCSSIAGYVGMYVSVRSNIRTAAAARVGLGGAIRTALRGGAVSGFLVVALSLLGVTAMYYAYRTVGVPIEEVPLRIVGFGFGASFVALFAQLGGGIYTKAADVGADLVGKVEVGIPEDDPRNPAVIADLVGDNVGDCAGRGADLFESTAAENIGAMILGVAIYEATGRNNPAWIIFPLVVLSFGILASMVGLMSVRGREDEDPMNWLNRGYYVTAVLSVVGLLIASFTMLQPAIGGAWIYFAGCGLVGIVTSLAFVWITMYYTTGTARPVQEIAQASKTGPATNIIAGIAIGFETTASTAIMISVALLVSYFLGAQTGITSPTLAQFNINAGGIFGTAVATMGMLMSAAYVLAMDTFGPITVNAGGIVEMSGQPESVRTITDALDSVGNTTKALTKGYAVGSAALAAFLLFSAYLESARLSVVNMARIEVFVAALLGAMLVFLFSSLAIRAVGKASSAIIEEVRRQFRADPGIMAGTSKPNYGACVDITTRSALREMAAPGLLAIGMPVIVGLVLRAEAEAGFLMVGTIAGILMATVLNNSGGAWDNGKKYIEAGYMKDDTGQVVKKSSPIHAAAVVGDTVGDPFKDTAGPSLHVLIKLLSTITLVLAPLFIG